MNTVKEFLSKEFGTIHAVNQDGQIYFSASDVARALGYDRTRSVTSKLYEDDKTMIPVETPGGTQNAVFISEAGLYCTIFKAEPAQARGIDKQEIQERLQHVQAFRRFVTEEVLPIVVKDGGYIDGEEKLDPEEREKLSEKVRALSEKVQSQLETIAANNLQIDEQHRLMQDLAVENGFRSSFDYDVPEIAGTPKTVKEMVQTICNDVHIVVEDNKALFVASDVAHKLGYSKATDMISGLDNDEAVKKSVNIGTQTREMLLLTESGLFHSLFNAMPARSTTLTSQERLEKTQQIRDFTKKVTRDVLRSIRENGGYIDGQECLPLTERAKLGQQIESLNKQVSALNEVIAEQKAIMTDMDETIEDMQRDAYRSDFAAYAYGNNGYSRDEAELDDFSDGYDSSDIDY